MLDIGIILKVAGVGILVSAAAQILSKSGRDEQSMLVTVAGIIVVLIMLIGEIEKLFELICSVFGF
jgi:stage III sporulation protein AC